MAAPRTKGKMPAKDFINKVRQATAQQEQAECDAKLAASLQGCCGVNEAADVPYNQITDLTQQVEHYKRIIKIQEEELLGLYRQVARSSNY